MKISPAFLMPITTAVVRGGPSRAVHTHLVGVGFGVKSTPNFSFAFCETQGLGWVSFVSKEARRWWGGCLGEGKKRKGWRGLRFYCVGDGPGICRDANEWISLRYPVSQGRYE